MTFNIPPKESNEVCIQCRTISLGKFHDCVEPCHRLVQWASDMAKANVAAVAADSARSIQALHREAEELRSD